MTNDRLNKICWTIRQTAKYINNRADRINLTQIECLLSANDLNQAKKLASELLYGPTRDLIPQDLWAYLEIDTTNVKLKWA